MSKTGSMFVGGPTGAGARGATSPSRSSGSTGPGKNAFEVLTMRLRPDGFRLAFTEQIDPETAAKIDSYQLQTYTYIYQSSYGSPEVDHTKPNPQGSPGLLGPATRRPGRRRPEGRTHPRTAPPRPPFGRQETPAAPAGLLHAELPGKVVAATGIRRRIARPPATEVLDGNGLPPW
ncbi:MAG: hypothetical protein Ct9H300mP1_23370 [Planctomycetaceae bacterium]|nr:MAG: hypothetical protein Ct9H300mP1_23370 [Planctomycetaceae bacterium]